MQGDKISRVIQNRQTLQLIPSCDYIRRIGRKLRVSLISLDENEFPRSIVNVAVCHVSRLPSSCRKTNGVREIHLKRSKRQIGRKERNIENVVHTKTHFPTLQFSLTS